MSRTWQIILICITLCVICILIYTWWKKDSFEGFQAASATNKVTLGSGWYTGTNMEVSFKGTGAASTKPESIATNIIVLTLNTPLINYKFQLPVEIWKTVGTLTTKVADAKLFSYNNPNVVIQGLNIDSWTPQNGIYTPVPSGQEITYVQGTPTTNPWVAGATGIRWNSQDTIVTPTATIYTIQANFCDIEINKTAGQCLTPNNDTLPPENVTEIDTYDNYEQYNISAIPAPIVTQHTEYNAASSLGAFDPTAPIPWDYDNMALNPADILWGNIHPNVSQSIFNSAYTREALQSINNLEYSADLGWTYTSLLFERTWTGDDKKFLPGIQMSEFLIETAAGVVIEGGYDRGESSIIAGTKWGQTQEATLRNMEDSEVMYRKINSTFKKINQWNAETKEYAINYRDQHFRNLSAMDRLSPQDRAACISAYDEVLGAEGTDTRKANKLVLQKLLEANEKMYTATEQRLKAASASINTEPNIAQRAAAADAAGSALPSDIRSTTDVPGRVSIPDPRLKASGTVPQGISSNVLRVIGKAGAQNLAVKSSGKLAVKLARAIGFTMAGQGLLTAAATTLCTATGGTTCPFFMSVVTTINIFLDIFVISCCSFVPAILAAYIPDDAVCPKGYFNIRDAMAKLPGGEVGWLIVSSIPGLGDGLATFGPYLCSKVENGFLTECALKTPALVPGYFYDSTLSIFADTTKAAMGETNGQFKDSRKYTTNASRRNSKPAWSDSGIPPIWVDFSDSRILDKMAQFYYNYSRKLAQDNGDGTQSFEYITKFYGVIASSEFSCDIQCEITNVTFFTSTGTIQSTQILPVDPTNGTTYHDRRFYFYPIQVANPYDAGSEISNPPKYKAYVSASNIERAYEAKLVNVKFLTYNQRLTYVAGNNDTELDALMTDNVNRYIVTACTHIDGTAPTALEVNNEGEYVGDALISLGDNVGNTYYPPIANINNPMLIALTNAYTIVPTDLGGGVPSPSLIEFKYNNPLISFIMPYRNPQGTNISPDIVQGVEIDNSNNPINPNLKFSGIVKNYISGSTQSVSIEITENTIPAGVKKYAISVKERSPGTYPPTNDNECSAIRNKVYRYGQTARQAPTNPTDFVAPSYVVSLPSTTPEAWAPYSKNQRFSKYRTGFQTQKRWSETYFGAIKSQSAISKEIAQGTAMGYIGFRFNYKGIPVGALISGGIMSTNFDPDYSFASLISCTYQDTLKDYGTYVVNGEIITIQQGDNNNYLYIKRGPIIAFAPGYTPIVDKSKSLVLTQNDCVNRTAIRRAVNTYNTQNTTQQITKVLKIETDAKNSKCLYLFETVPYNPTTTLRDNTNPRRNGMVIQYRKTSNEYALIQPPTILTQFTVNSDGSYTPPTGPGDFQLSVQSTTFPISGDVWGEAILPPGARLVPADTSDSTMSLRRQGNRVPNNPIYTCATPEIQRRLITQFNNKHKLNPIITSISQSYVPEGGVKQEDGTYKCIYNAFVTRFGEAFPDPAPIAITMVISPANDPQMALYDLVSDNYPKAYIYENIPKPNQWITIPAPLPPETSILRTGCTNISTCADPSITSNLVNQFNAQMVDGKIMKVRKAYTPLLTGLNVCDYEVEMLRTFNIGISTNSLVQKENIRLPIIPSPSDQCMWDLNLTGSNVPNANTGVSLTNSASVELLDTPYVWAPSVLGNIQNTINNAIMKYLDIDIAGILSNKTATVNREVTNVYETVITSQNLYNATCTVPKQCKDNNIIQTIIDGYYEDNYPTSQYGAVQRKMTEIRRVGTYDSNTCQVEFVEKVDTYNNFISSVMFNSDASDSNVKFNTRYYLRQYQFNMIPRSNCTFNMSSIRSIVSTGDFSSIDISNNNAIAIMSDSSVVPSGGSIFSFTGNPINCTNTNIMKAVQQKYNKSYRFSGTNNFNSLTAFSTAFNPEANVCEYTIVTSRWFKSLTGGYYTLPNVNVSLKTQWSSYTSGSPIDYSNPVEPDVIEEFDPAKIKIKVDSSGKYQSYDSLNNPIVLPYTYRLPLDYNRERVSTVSYVCNTNGCSF